MAELFIGVNTGQGVADVTSNSSTVNKDVEVVINDANIPAAGRHAKTDVREALQAIIEYWEQYDY